MAIKSVVRWLKAYRAPNHAGTEVPGFQRYVTVHL